jgi:hypothetical protein
LVSSTNKTDCHNITEKLLKVALNTITLTPDLSVLEKYQNLVIEKWFEIKIKTTPVCHCLKKKFLYVC